MKKRAKRERSGPRRDQANLTTLFEELNRIFFSGRLPPYKVRLTSFDTNTGEVQHGECLPEKQTILINSGLSGEDLRMTLLHEMCHIGSIGHGKKFQSKLRRLALMGEDWAEEQRGDYEMISRSNMTFTQQLKNEVEDLAGYRPDLSWVEVRRYLAREFHVPPLKLIKSAPWLRRRWKREQQLRREKEQILGKALRRQQWEQ